MAEIDNVPGLTGRRGEHQDHGYEVWFLTLTDRASGQGFWIRTTYLAPRRGSRSAGVWFARFDPADPARTFGIHRNFHSFSFDGRGFDVRAGGAVMASGRAEGSVAGDGHQASWRLSWPTGEPTYRLLPDWMYRGSFAPTKPFSPNVSTRATGEVIVDGERLELSEAPTQQGHLYGSRHAERWAWAHCGDPAGEDATIHALTAQGRRGPYRTPFVTSVGVKWDGRWIRLSKASRARDFGLGSWHVDVGNRRYRLTGRIEAPARDLLRARYTDPDGTDRFCHNSEIASCRLALFERHAGGFDEIALFESKGGTHAEWAGRTPAHAVEREHVDVTGDPEDVAGAVAPPSGGGGR